MPLYDKEKTLKFLDENNIKYEKIEHEAAFTMEELDKLGITSKGLVVKNLFLRDAKGKIHYLISAPEERKIEMNILAGKIGSTRLSFASDERLMKYLGVKQGSVSPLGILNDENHEVIVVFDQALMGKDSIGVHPNENTATCFISFKDLKSIIEKHGNKFLCVKL